MDIWILKVVQLNNFLLRATIDLDRRLCTIKSSDMSLDMVLVDWFVRYILLCFNLILIWVRFWLIFFIADNVPENGL